MLKRCKDHGSGCFCTHCLLSIILDLEKRIQMLEKEKEVLDLKKV